MTSPRGCLQQNWLHISSTVPKIAIQFYHSCADMQASYNWRSPIQQHIKMKTLTACCEERRQIYCIGTTTWAWLMAIE